MDELGPEDFFSDEDLKAVVVILRQERDASANVAKRMEDAALELEEKDDEESKRLARHYRAGEANARERVRQIDQDLRGWRA